MPRYSCDPADGWGEFPPVWPAMVFDANGREVDWVIRCDTETGWCEFFTRDDSGEEVADPDGNIGRYWVQHPAPLRLEPMRGAVSGNRL
jgi:hypothetical protein